MPIDLSVFVVAVARDRAAASATRSIVSSGHLTCAKWTSSLLSIPARAIASATPRATLSI